MASGKSSIQKRLKAWFSDADKVVVAGVGNPIRKDDAVGIKIVHDLMGKVSEKVFLIECETVPEGYVDQIVAFKPTHVLLIDAAVLGLKPGESRFVEPEQLLAFPAFSTHMLPLRIFCEYVAKMAGAKIALLLVEPKDASFGEGLTGVVEASSQKLVRILLKALP